MAAEVFTKNAAVGRALIDGGRFPNRSVDNNKNLVVEELDLSNLGEDAKPKKSGFTSVKIKFGSKKQDSTSNETEKSVSERRFTSL